MLNIRSVLAVSVTIITSFCVVATNAFAAPVASESVLEPSSAASLADNGLYSNTPVIDTSENNFSEVEKLTTVRLEQVKGEAEVALHKDGKLSIKTRAVIDGKPIDDSFVVTDIKFTGQESGDFIAVLRSEDTGRLVNISTEVAQPQAFPVLVILGAIARVGINFAIKQYSKAQIKKAAKSYLLNNLNRNMGGVTLWQASIIGQALVLNRESKLLTL